MKDKRVVLITGASSGIGLASCKLFAENGWHVIGVARRKMPDNKYMARYQHADLSDSVDIERIVKGLEKQERRLNALINNAAHQICKPLDKTSLEEWRKVFAVNVEAPFLLAKGCLPLLKKTKGSIVNVSSVHAIASSNNISSYAASKGALLSLTRNMAIEFGKFKIRANAVVPGAIDTPMLEAGMNRAGISGKDLRKQLNNMGKKHLLGKVGSPKEVAQAVFFLADTKQASFITGQSIVIDGGATSKLSTE